MSRCANSNGSAKTAPIYRSLARAFAVRIVFLCTQRTVLLVGPLSAPALYDYKLFHVFGLKFTNIPLYG